MNRACRLVAVWVFGITPVAASAQESSPLVHIVAPGVALDSDLPSIHAEGTVWRVAEVEGVLVLFDPSTGRLPSREVQRELFLALAMTRATDRVDTDAIHRVERLLRELRDSTGSLDSASGALLDGLVSLDRGRGLEVAERILPARLRGALGVARAGRDAEGGAGRALVGQLLQEAAGVDLEEFELRVGQARSVARELSGRSGNMSSELSELARALPMLVEDELHAARALRIAGALQDLNSLTGPFLDTLATVADSMSSLSGGFGALASAAELRGAAEASSRVASATAFLSSVSDSLRDGMARLRELENVWREEEVTLATAYDRLLRRALDETVAAAERRIGVSVEVERTLSIAGTPVLPLFRTRMEVARDGIGEDPNATLAAAALAIHESDEAIRRRFAEWDSRTLALVEDVAARRWLGRQPVQGVLAALEDARAAYASNDLEAALTAYELTASELESARARASRANTVVAGSGLAGVLLIALALLWIVRRSRV